jgi:hypothetical protein
MRHNPGLVETNSAIRSEANGAGLFCSAVVSAVNVGLRTVRNDRRALRIGGSVTTPARHHRPMQPASTTGASTGSMRWRNGSRRKRLDMLSPETCRDLHGRGRNDQIRKPLTRLGAPTAARSAMSAPMLGRPISDLADQHRPYANRRFLRQHAKSIYIFQFIILWNGTTVDTKVTRNTSFTNHLAASHNTD